MSLSQPHASRSMSRAGQPALLWVRCSGPGVLPLTATPTLPPSPSTERLFAPVCGGHAAQPSAGDPGADHPLLQPDGAGAGGVREERVEEHVHGGWAELVGGAGTGLPVACAACCQLGVEPLHPTRIRPAPSRHSSSSSPQVFTTAASDESPQIVRLAFDTVEKIVREHFHYITGGWRVRALYFSGPRCGCLCFRSSAADTLLLCSLSHFSPLPPTQRRRPRRSPTASTASSPSPTTPTPWMCRSTPSPSCASARWRWRRATSGS